MKCVDSLLLHLSKTISSTPCKECQTALKRRDLKAHKATCNMVDVQCDCGVAFKRMNEKEHRERTYNLFKVPCPLKCGENIKR